MNKTTTIMLVDDNSQILEYEKEILESYGLKVVTAESGPECLAAVKENPPDMILLDVSMPGMNGFAVCEELRKFSHVPVIFVTVGGGENDEVTAFNLGADGFVTKPFSGDTLVARINSVLRRYS